MNIVCQIDLQLLAVDLRNSDLVFDRASLRGNFRQLLYSRDVHKSGVHIEGTHYGFR